MGLKISDALGAGGNVSEGKCRSDCLRESAVSDCSPSDCDSGSNHLAVGVGGRAIGGALPSGGGPPVGDKGVRGSGALPGVGVKVIRSSLSLEKGDDEPGRSHSDFRRSVKLRGGVWV